MHSNSQKTKIVSIINETYGYNVTQEQIFLTAVQKYIGTSSQPQSFGESTNNPTKLYFGYFSHNSFTSNVENPYELKLKVNTLSSYFWKSDQGLSSQVDFPCVIFSEL